MEKLCEILIKTGEGKFVPIGIAKLELIFGWDNISRNNVLTKSILKKSNINIEEGDIIWEAKPDLWVS